MYGIHIVYECLHCLVNTADGAVYGMLQGAVAAGEAVERALDIVCELCVVQFAVVFATEYFHILYFFNKR